MLPTQRPLEVLGERTVMDSIKYRTGHSYAPYSVSLIDQG